MIYRTEHPKPQFERENWINLNGQWQFEIDRANSGVDRKLFDDSVSLKDSICILKAVPKPTMPISWHT